jgi:hypothetical protein
MSDRGYGYYPEEEGGLYTAGLLTGGGLKSFREGKPKKGVPTVSVPSLTWGISRLQRVGRGAQLKNTKWWGFMQKALEEAREKYLASLTEEEKKKYLAGKKKQLEAKDKKVQKLELVRKALEGLKGDTKEKTAENIAKALLKEGNPKTRVLRSAMAILYPELKEKRDNKGGYPALKQYKVKGLIHVPRKKPKGTSYIGFKNPIKVDEEKINERLERLEEVIERMIEHKEPKEELIEKIVHKKEPKEEEFVEAKPPPKTRTRTRTTRRAIEVEE